MGFVLEEQDERDRAEDDVPEVGDPMAEVAQFPLLSIALKPLLAGGTINTEEVFEAGLQYMVTGIRASLAGRPRADRRTKAAPARRSKRVP